MFNTRDNRTDSEVIPTSYKSFSVESITPHIGAIVQDIDLSKSLSNEQVQDVYDAWYDWKVLVFRNQKMSREDHKGFARHFGKLHVHPMQHQMRGDPEVLIVKTTAKSPYTAGDGWHTDVTCDEKPPLGSMLYLTETPNGGGGATLFADMYLAYDLLSDPFKIFIESLSAEHDGSLPYVGSYKSAEPSGGYPRNSHPVVVRHPVTGRKVLYVNEGFTSRINELSRKESNCVLDMLYRHINSTPRLWCQVNWEPDTLTFWDNRCTQHHAVWDYYPNSRYGERVSIVGNERPTA